MQFLLDLRTLLHASKHLLVNSHNGEECILQVKPQCHMINLEPILPALIGLINSNKVLGKKNETKIL